MFDVITVGSSTVDVFAKVESQLVKIKSIRHTEEFIAYPSGTKILINNLEFLSGGGGTNAAVALARLGLRIGYIGKIGSDNYSSLIKKVLKDEKIKFLGKFANGISGYSIILDSLEGDRTILTYKGVNNSLDFKDIKTRDLKTKWFYFSSMVEKSYEALEKLAKYASENKIKVAFNPSNYLSEKGHLYLKEVLSRTDLLVLNKEEAVLLVGKVDEAALILELMKLGPKAVVLTAGKVGSFTINNKILYQVVPHELTPVETTGAGDAFASTYLAGTIMGKDIETCLKMAALNAEGVIMQKGAKKGLLKKSELAANLKKKATKVIKKKLTF